MYVALMKKAEIQLGDELPFVMYRKPKENTVQAIFQNTNQINYVKDYSETGFVFAPFDSSDDTILLQADKVYTAAVTSKEIPIIKKEILNEFKDNQKSTHLKLVEKGIEAIREGVFEKVVLSRRIEIDCIESPFKLFQKIVAMYANEFCYLWYHPKVGMWLGATPEILLQMQGRQLTTMSLAGTQVGHDDKPPIWGEKEIHEQELVTKYINDILQDSLVRLNIASPESTKAGSLWHLRTKISGTIKKGRFPEIVNILHPTPAVCGLPLQTSKAFILNNENYKRAYYTGFLGELNFKKEKERAKSKRNMENRAFKAVNKTSTLYVNLRCMQLKENKAFVYVGGGVTKDSIPEKEWQEVVAKSNTMLKVLS